MFKALTWIGLSKVNGPALPKERWIKVDKAPPGKIGSQKKLLTIRFFSKCSKIPNNFRDCLTIESHDTNRDPTLNG
jgi:hypothetical protein